MTIKKAVPSILILTLFTCAFVPRAHAVTKGINTAVLTDYTPAIENRGLETAYVDPDPSKFRNYVVIEKGGIPAERARHFVTWAEYDYRGVVIHLDEEDRISTRRGRPYTYLRPGDVMAVAGIKYFSNTIYLKLISDDVYVPLKRSHDKRHSRVTVMLGFKFPKGVIKGDDAETVIAEMVKWLKPFPNLQDARAYARQLKGEDAYAAAPAGKGAPSAPSKTSPAAEKVESEKMKSLEEKIENARRELDEAEEELKSMKESK